MEILKAVCSHLQHREKGPKEARFFVLTISTSRYDLRLRGISVKDESGDKAEELIKSHGYTLVGRDLLPDDLHLIRSYVAHLLTRNDIDVIVVTGGTGIARKDVTVEAIKPLIEKEIEGFGELFRFLSYGRIGPAAMLSRAFAGIANGKLVIALPGSPDGVEAGLRLILPEVPHILYLIRS